MSIACEPRREAALRAFDGLQGNPAFGCHLAAMGPYGLADKWVGVMRTTTETINVAQDATPEFGDAKIVRKMFSLSRAHLYRLSADGKIQSACLRQRGNLRGRRLWYLPSVRDYLFANMEGSSE